MQNIKNKQKEEEAKKETSPVLPLGTTEKIPEVSKVVVKKPLKQRIWEEIVHYYHGFRLLFVDIYICRKLLWRVLSGKKLTRRESNLLVRTSADLFRLIPFSIFIIVPFLEFLLPFFIKFFPGMLPSTFQTAKEREDKLKQSLQVKLEVAKFLQKTLDQMAVQHKDRTSEEAKNFSEFFRRIKDSKESVTSEEIQKFSKQFEDEVTIDALSREQLTALCRIVEMSTIGTTNFLKFQLRMKLRSLAADDKLIQKEGVDSLNLYELQQACKSRGMRAYGLSEMKLRKQLQEWIDLSLNEKIPPVLLLLSRALMVPEETSTTDKLKRTISVLPDSVATQTKAAIGEKEGKIDNKTKIELIKEEERKIKEEREEEKEVEKQEEKIDKEVLLDKAPTFKDSLSVKAKKTDEVLTSKDVEVLGEALETLSKDKKQLLVEKETIKELKEEIEEYKEDVEELREITTAGPKETPVQETRAAKILYKKVNYMIDNLDKVLKTLEKKEKKIREDLQGEAQEKSDLLAQKKDQLLRIDEVVEAIKQLRKVSDQSKLNQIEKVLSTLDTDKDGRIKVDDVLKVIEAIGRENVKLNEKQLEELVELLDKEEFLEAEDKIEKALAKSIKEAKKEAEELNDSAPTLVDKAPNLNSEQGIIGKGTAKEPPITDAIRKEAANAQKDKIIPQSPPEMPSPLPPPIPATNAKPKDKML